MKQATFHSTPLRQRVAERLMTLRKLAGLTQMGLAERLRVHRAFVSKVERGETNISLDTYERFVGAIAGQEGAPDVRLRELVGERLRAARTEAGFTQEGLSQAAGFSVLFVGRVERGVVSTSLDRVEQLALALGLDGESLVHDKTGIPGMQP